MSKPVFYRELINLDDFSTHLRERGFSDYELLQLITELEEVFHVKTLDFILEELPEEHHEEFLIIFAEDPLSASHWEFLHAKAPNLKDRVSQKLDKFKADLLDELRR